MSSLWWEQVPNARRFINSIGESVRANRNVALFLPKDLPWYDSMCSEISEVISDAYRTTVKISDDKGADPGEIIFNKFCKPEVRNAYRPNIGFAKFLATRTDLVLKERYIWIKNVDGSRQNLWLDFMSEYHKQLEKASQTGAVFIIELPSNTKVLPHKGFDFIKYDDYIHSFDRYVYNTLVASSIDDNNRVKQYLAELISEVSGNDMEIATICGSERGYESFMRDAAAFLKDIEGTPRSDGSSIEIDLTEDQIKQKIWNAQIKILFPLIEEHRLMYTEKYKSQIDKYLPIKNEYDVDYTQASEVEIGVLWHLMSNQDVLVNEKDKMFIMKCKDARNDLAHLTPLSYDKLMAILR